MIVVPVTIWGLSGTEMPKTFIAARSAMVKVILCLPGLVTQPLDTPKQKRVMIQQNKNRHPAESRTGQRGEAL
jgi:hypothetical protein